MKQLGAEVIISFVRIPRQTDFVEILSTLATPVHHAERTAAICIDYVNYRGERALRNIIPHHIYFGEVDWHPGEQWILDAWDLDKCAIRSFAVADIVRWNP